MPAAQALTGPERHCIRQVTTTSILSDVTAGAAVAAIPLLFWADVLPFWLLLALAFLISVFNAPGDLARRALVPTLAGWAAMPLERANAADTAIPRLSQLVGPLIGGILVAVAGAQRSCCWTPQPFSCRPPP